jgi:hypothetical protein
VTEDQSDPPIPRPERWIKNVRTAADGSEQLVFVGYVDSAVPDGKGSLKVSAKGPAGLLSERTLPFQPPMIEESSHGEAFDFHWRVLDYIFGLPDPREFPALGGPLPDEEQEVVNRYVRTARDLAGSGVLNAAGEGLTVQLEDETDAEHVKLKLSERDRQVGFAALLRHCDSKNERASFPSVADILWRATERESGVQSERQEVLKAWRRAVGKLHGKSMDQLLREKLADEEGMGVLAYEEVDSPNLLLSAFDYGDLLHWDRKRAVVAEWEQDEFLGGERRLAFLTAAAALAHVYIGFAVLAETATSRADLV